MNTYMIYGTTFLWKNKADWFPIYQLTEPENYSSVENLEETLDDLAFLEDLESYQYLVKGKTLDSDGKYLIFLHHSTQTFYIGLNKYFTYLASHSVTAIPTIPLEDYQKFLIFLNTYQLKVDFKNIGMYIFNDSDLK